MTLASGLSRPFAGIRRPFAGRRLRGAAVATAVVASSVLGLTAVGAAPASAVTSSACTHQVRLDTWVTATVNFRTGPGTGYTSKGLLMKGQGIYWACYRGNWGYVKPYYGAHKGQYGWVSRTYIDVPMQTD